jgi:cytochrome c553
MKGLAALFALAGWATFAWGQSAPAKPDLAKGQVLVTQVCSACHGADGNSAVPVNPRLAGQVPEYMAKQLASFKENKERKNPVMFGMALPLSPQDMLNVAAYYGGQKAKEGVARNKEILPLGQKLYRGGDLSRALPSCASCHGATGAGMPSQYPRLSGQFAEYTELQLKTFRSGERANDPSRVMRSIAEKMSDVEIKAVADYIAGLH